MGLVVTYFSVWNKAKGKLDMCVKCLRGWWVVPVLVLSSLGAAGRTVPLVDAVKGGSVDDVRALLQEHDVNTPEADGTTALHWAVHRNDVAVAGLLIRAGADVTAVNRYGVTPLPLAAENGSAAMAGRLLEAGAEANATVGTNETALMTAARTGDVDTVRVLLTYGAEVQARENWLGQTALMWAAAENNPDASKVLIAAGADVQARSAAGFTPLLFSAQLGHIEAAGVLLAAGADVDAPLPDGMSPLVVAVANGNYDFAAWLLEQGANPNAAEHGWTALHHLSWVRRPNVGQSKVPGPVTTGTVSSLDLIVRLIDHGADPDARQQQEPRDGYRNLLDRKGATPFLLAAKAADVEMMRVLFENGADPLSRTDDQTTPLMVAAGVGIYSPGENPGTNEEALEAVKLAAELGGNVRAVSDYGYTALHGAAHRGAPEIVQFLADNGAKLDAKLTKSGGGRSGWTEGWTALAIADGQFYGNTFKRSPETATLLRDLLSE
ncbi:MAG: hypothetical protein CL484_08185 [Acidobacteria bacterium]|nr:hypothetical protein [Acidobacteriota bacterium]